MNAVDFGDLLLEALRLLRERPEILADYQRRLRYLLVDEYQDTNVVQYLWLRLLAQGHRNLCCVGDDDQSIYGWRGADVDNILRFERDFPGATVIRLERNYRSRRPYPRRRRRPDRPQPNRLGKTLYTEAGLGEKPTVAALWDSQEEARVVGDEIEAAQRAGTPLREMAILVRASFQMREFEERFIALGVPYRVIGGPRFYERAEVRDALAYLRCVVQPDDDLAFERIYNTPRRGLGEATLNLLHAYRRSAGVSLTRAARAMTETEELRARPRSILRDLLRDFDRWAAAAETAPHDELAQTILEESGLIDMWKAERTADAEGRLENLKELVRSMGEFPEPRRLSRARVAGDGGGERRGRGPRVDHDPARRQRAGVRHRLPARLGGGSVSASARPRRERPRRARGGAPARLCRADARAPRGEDLLRRQPPRARPVAEFDCRRASSTSCRPTMSRWSRRRAAPRSMRPRASTEPAFASRYETPGWRRAQSYAGQAQCGAARCDGAPRVIEGQAIVREAPSAHFAIGARVFHLKFGNGDVVAVDGAKLTVEFDRAGRKMVLDSFVSAAG